MSNPTIASSKVTGTNVYSPNGEKVGAIDELIIDKHSGLVRFATIESGGFLGMGSEHRSVPWQALSYDVQREGYVVPLAQLATVQPREAPKDRHGIDDFFGERSI